MFFLSLQISTRKFFIAIANKDGGGGGGGAE